MSVEHSNHIGNIPQRDGSKPEMSSHERAQDQFDTAVHIARAQGKQVTLTVNEDGHASYATGQLEPVPSTNQDTTAFCDTVLPNSPPKGGETVEKDGLHGIVAQRAFRRLAQKEAREKWVKGSKLAPKQQRHVDNLGRLTGWFKGIFYRNGKPQKAKK